MKIGLDIRPLMDKHYSGVSEYTYNLINNLLAIDKTNEYFLYYNSFRNLDNRIPNFESSRVKIIKTKYPNKIFNYFLQKIFKCPKIDKKLGKMDIFLAPHINFLSLSSGPKKILTIHDLSFLRHPEFFSGRKNFWHKMINVKNLTKGFDKVVAVSENTKNDLVDLCQVSEDKVQVIYSGVNDSYHPLRKNDEQLPIIREKYNLPHKFILYLGNIEPRKNLGGLIRAYNHLRREQPDLSEYKLVIAGATGWKIGDTFVELNNSPYKDDVIFLGYVDKNDKAALYNLATIFVYPSFYEGFGFPPLEAMACGLPVVTSNISSLPEIVGGAALTIDPYNVQALSQAMIQVLDNEGLRDELSIKGLERAKNFSWQKTAQQYLDLFNTL